MCQRVLVHEPAWITQDSPRPAAKFSLLAAIDWDAMLAKTVAAPWVPDLKDPFDVSHFDEFDDHDNIQPYYHDASTDSEDGPWFTGF